MLNICTFNKNFILRFIVLLQFTAIPPPKDVNFFQQALETYGDQSQASNGNIDQLETRMGRRYTLMKGSRPDVTKQHSDVTKGTDDVTNNDEYIPMINRASLDDVTSQDSSGDVISNENGSLFFYL